MESDHYVGEVAQKAIIEKDGKILLVLAPGDSNYDLPGGRLHKGEQPAVGLSREVFEELGAKIIIEKPAFVGSWASPSGELRYFVAFECKLEDKDIKFVLQADEIASTKWIGKEELGAVSLYEICRNALDVYFKNK